MADEADRSIVLELLQVAILGKCDDQGLGPRGWPFSCLPDFFCRLSRVQWPLLLHLLGPVLLGCCQLRLTSLSSMIILQPLLLCEGPSGWQGSKYQLLCEGWGGRPLCLSGDSSVLIDLRWSCDCSAQPYSLHRISISRYSVGRFPDLPERSWIVVVSPSFTVVKSFTSWYALLLLFFPRFSSVSPHRSPIQFFFALCMHLLMLFSTSLYFSDPSGSNLVFLSFSHFVTQVSDPGFFFSRCLPKISLPCVPAGSPSRGGDVAVYVLDINHRACPFLFILFLCFYLYGLLTCILIHKFLLSSSGLLSALLVNIFR